MTKTYKVVSISCDGRKMSALPKCPVEYKPGEFVEAEVGGLLCFDNPFSAFAFILGLGWYTSEFELWEATGDESLPLPPCQILVGLDKDTIAKVWNNSNLTNFVTRWPKGTVAFRRVRLDRPVFSPRLFRSRKPLSEGLSDTIAFYVCSDLHRIAALVSRFSGRDIHYVTAALDGAALLDEGIAYSLALALHEIGRIKASNAILSIMWKHHEPTKPQM